MLLFYLFSVPLYALCGIFKNNALGFKLVSDTVGLSPVSVLTGLCSLLDKILNLVIKAILFTVKNKTENSCKLVEYLYCFPDGALVCVCGNYI